MRQVLQQTPTRATFARSGSAVSRSGAVAPIPTQGRADSWEESWQQGNARNPSSAPAAWWAVTDEGFTLLQRMSLAHLLVGVCVALALGWQLWASSGLAPTPAIGLIVAVGGALALVLSRLEYPAMLVGARLALVAVDLCAAGGILWLRGGEGWTLLVLLPPIALAVAFFAERGGALATVLSALMIVAVNGSQTASTSGWVQSLLVFLGVAVLIVAFLGIYTTQVTETNQNLRWLLSDARTASEHLHTERHVLLGRLRSVEQAQEPLLHERARFAEAAAELTMLTQRLAQGDPAAVPIAQSLRPGAYGPLAELASALVRLSRVSAGSRHPSVLAALDTPVRAQGQALESLDTVTRSLSVGANELVLEAQTLEPGVSLIGSGHYTQALWHLEDHLRAQASQMALLGTQIAGIRSAQENLEMMLARTAAGAKTPTIFATSDVRSMGPFAESYPQGAFGASAIRPAPVTQQHGNGTDRGGNWQNQPPMAYNRGV